MSEIQVIGFGAPCIDYVIQNSDPIRHILDDQTDGRLEIDEKTFQKIILSTGSPPKILPGGSACNVLRGLAKQGHFCALSGVVGEDDSAIKLRDNFKEYGILPLFQKRKGFSAKIICIVHRDGRRTMRALPGVSTDWSIQEFNLDSLREITHAHMEGYFLLQDGLAEKVIQHANNTSLDLASHEIVASHKKRIQALIPKLDLLFANEKEAHELTGLPPDRAACSLSQQGPTTIITIGEKGCCIAKNQELFHFPAYPAKPLDTTGAGDLFASGFLHGHLSKKPLSESAHQGALLAREVIQIEGAELPDSSWKNLPNH